MDKNDALESRIHEQLRTHGFRITDGRVKLLELLYKVQKPLSIQEISKLWRGKLLNQTTLYRTLTDLAVANIVRRVDLNTGTAHFEYTPDRPHHHHIVCTNCDAVEDVEHCSVEMLQKQVMRCSKQFKHIYSHNLEFFGRCENCPQT